MIRRVRQAREESAGPRLVAATYNIHTCVGVDRRHAPERIAEVLCEINADIIGLQEVEMRHRVGSPADQLSYFAEATGLRAVPGPDIRDHRSRFGNAILTRYPVRSVRYIDLSVDAYEPRGAIDAELEVDERKLRVVVTHLGLHAGERRRQIHRLLDQLARGGGDTDATLIMGDLNEWRGRRGGIPALDRHLGRAPMPRTFPSWLPMLPLDRIYAGGTATLRVLSVHRSPLARLASDHLPLRAVVGWDEASRQ